MHGGVGPIPESDVALFAMTPAAVETPARDLLRFAHAVAARYIYETEPPFTPRFQRRMAGIAFRIRFASRRPAEGEVLAGAIRHSLPRIVALRGLLQRYAAGHAVKTELASEWRAFEQLVETGSSAIDPV